MQNYRAFESVFPKNIIVKAIGGQVLGGDLMGCIFETCYYSPHDFYVRFHQACLQVNKFFPHRLPIHSVKLPHQSEDWQGGDAGGEGAVAAAVEDGAGAGGRAKRRETQAGASFCEQGGGDVHRGGRGEHGDGRCQQRERGAGAGAAVGGGGVGGAGAGVGGAAAAAGGAAAAVAVVNPNLRGAWGNACKIVLTIAVFAFFPLLCSCRCPSSLPVVVIVCFVFPSCIFLFLPGLQLRFQKSISAFEENSFLLCVRIVQCVPWKGHSLFFPRKRSGLHCESVLIVLASALFVGRNTFVSEERSGILPYHPVLN